jgi:hypothetical protein
MPRSLKLRELKQRAFRLGADIEKIPHPVYGCVYQLTGHGCWETLQQVAMVLADLERKQGNNKVSHPIKEML